MKAISLVVPMALLAMLATACGGPSKDDVCGKCSDEAVMGISLKSTCEAAYDACKDSKDCKKKKLKDMEDEMNKLCSAM